MHRARWILLSLLLVPALLACAGNQITIEPAPLERPVVDRLDGETVRIRWPESFSKVPVTVFAGPRPDAIDRRRPLATSAAGSVKLTRSDALPFVAASRRTYYELVPADGAPPAITAERRLPLRGADNFRDLGGYRTRDGRTVRWGRLYRSNELTKLTRSDLAYLSSQDIELVCDLRSKRERAEAPDPELPPVPARDLSLPVAQEGIDPTTVQERIRTGGVPSLQLERVMPQVYRAFVTHHSDKWARMLRRLADPQNLPTVVHCTAGKDRTGFAAALVLLALGVPRETVFEDYLKTNDYRRDFSSFVLRWTPLYSLFRTDPEDLLPLLEARREYLQASLDAIERTYGTVEAYLHDALGVTPERQAALEANLLR